MAESRTSSPEPVVEVLRRRAALESQNPAYTFLLKGERPVKTLSFAALDLRARAIAAMLTSHAKSQARVLMIYSPGLEFIEAFWGCLYARLIAVPASLPHNPYGVARLQAIAADCSPHAILCSRQHLDELKGKFSSICGRIIATDDVPDENAENWSHVELASSDVALLQYSSGSTASPKGVIVSHRNIFANQMMIKEACSHTAASTFVGWLPFSHDMGLFGNIIQPLFIGAHSILMSPLSFLQKPLRWLQAVSDYKAYTSGGPNFGYEYCVRRVGEEDKAGLDLSHWKIAFNGAEKPRMNTMKQFTEAFAKCGFNERTFYPCYGLAEAVLFVTGRNKIDCPLVSEGAPVADGKGDTDVPENRHEPKIKHVSSGRAWLEQRIAIAHPEHHTECDSGHVGEVWVKGPNIAEGYWNKPVLSQATFRAFLSGSGEGPFLRTGDLGFVNNDELYVVGRMKDLIILRGQNYYPEDIEAVVEACHGGVEPGQSAAFAIEGANSGELLVVVIEAPKNVADETALQAICDLAAALVSLKLGIMINRLLVVRRGTIPKTTSGKIQRFRCRELFLADALDPLKQINFDEEPQHQEDAHSPDTFRPDIRNTCGSAWKETILAGLQERVQKLSTGAGRKAVDPRSSLVQIGLDSIRAVELKQWIEQVARVSISVAELFESSSLHALVEMIETRSIASQFRSTERLPFTKAQEIQQLSFGQEALYFEYERDPSSSIYNISTAIELQGEIDKANLGRAFSALLLLHPELTATFVKDADGLTQKWRGRTKSSLEFVDGSLWTVDECARQVNQTANLPFNLAESAARFVLFIRSDSTSILLIVIHHIVIDLLSLELILRDLATLCAESGMGNQDPAREHGASYGQFAEWQRQFVASSEGKQSFDFWRRKLESRTESPALAFSRSMPDVRSKTGGAYYFTIGRKETARIREFAASREVTPYIVLLSAYAVVLGQFIRESELIIGTSVIGRPEQKYFQVAGYFTNIVALPFSVDAENRFDDLLAQAKVLVRSALDHQYYPFSLMVEGLGRHQNLSRAPLVRYAFTFGQARHSDSLGLLREDPCVQIKFGSMVATGFPLDRQMASFDLTLMVLERDGHLHASFSYVENLIDHEAIPAFSAAFTALLSQLISRPDVAIASHEIQRLPEHATPPGEETGENRGWDSVVMRFERQAAARPNAIAASYKDQHVSYGALQEWSGGFADYLRILGIGLENLVAVYCPRGLEMLAAILGIAKAGAAYLPIEINTPPERLRLILEDAQAKAVLTLSGYAAVCEGTPAEVIVLDGGGLQIAGRSQSRSYAPVDPNNLAYVIYTSGSTGKPKGVAVTHDNISKLFDATRSYGFTNNDVWTLYHSISFDFSVWEMWGALSYGGRLIVLDHESTRYPEEVYECVLREQITVLNQTPSAFYNLLPVMCRRDDDTSLSLRYVIFGGEALKVEQLGPWFDHCHSQSTALVNMYGITETTVHNSWIEIEKRHLAERHGSPIGESLPRLEFYILNTGRNCLPPYAVGEISVSGPGLARGYYGRPSLTAERFIPNPFGADLGSRMYLTGDLAYSRKDQKDLHHIGRLDRQVKVRGHRIELRDIEVNLCGCEGVRWATVLAGAMEAGDDTLTAYVVCNEDITVPVLREHLARLVPEYMIPAKFIRVEEVPTNDNGKVDIPKLRSCTTTLPTGNNYAAPRTAAERAMAGIWGEVLHLNGIGIDDNYFELGGDSIRSIQIISKAKNLGLKVELAQLMQGQTIRSLLEENPLNSNSDPNTWCGEFELVGDSDRRRLPQGLEDAFPMNSLLQGLMFHSQFSDDYQVYVTSFHVKAPRDPAKLRQALEITLKEHPYLRSSFDSTSYKEPLQLVHATVALNLAFEDISGAAPAEQERRIQSFIEEQKRQKFDWDRSSPLRFVIHRRSHDSFQITLAEPFLDGWCVALLFARIFNVYLSLVRSNKAPELVLTSFSQRHLVQLEREARNDKKQLLFWKHYLDSCPSSLISRVNYKQAFTPILHNRKTVVIPDSVMADIEKLARSASVPVRTVLLAVHAHLLSVLLDQKDILFGVMLNGRPEEGDGDKIVGAFLNTVPFRIAVNPRETWFDFVRRVFAMEIEILPHRRVPFSELKKLHGKNLQFDTVFNFTHFHALDSLKSKEGFQILDVYASEQTFFPLTVHFNRSILTSEMELVLDYDCRELSLEQVDLLSECYLKTIAAVSETGSKPEFGQLSAKIYQHLFPAPPTQEAAALTNAGSVIEMIEHRARIAPDAIALVEGEQSVTYRQLKTAVETLACYLLKNFSVQPDDLLGVHALHSISAIIGILAILKAGGAYVPIDESCPPERMQFIISDCGLKCILTESSLASRLQQYGILIVRTEQVYCRPEAVDRAALARVCPDAASLAYVIFTSGSTGQPKGVGVQHQSLANLSVLASQEYKIGPEDRILQFCTLEFDISAEEIFTCLCTGATLVLRPRELLDSYEIFHDYCARAAITCLNVPTAFWNDWVAELANSAWRYDLALRLVIIAGEQMLPELALQWKKIALPEVLLVNTYGPTEATVKASKFWVNEDERTLAALQLQGSPIGTGIANATLSVLDTRLRPVSPGIFGELYLGGPGVARGYRNRARLTAERFLPDPWAALPGARQYRTGDISFRTESGDVHFVGRLDLQVKINGFRVELEEVEAVLMDCRGIRQAAVIADSSESKATLLKSYLRLEAGVPDDPAQEEERIRRELKNKVPSYMVPASLKFVDELPVNSSGKIDRARLKQLCSNDAKQISCQAPDSADPVLEIVGSTFAYCLGTTHISQEDDFFSMGGGSLAAMRVAARLRGSLGCSVSVREVLENPGVRQLAGLLNERLASPGVVESEPAPVRENEYPLSFAQERLWMAEHLTFDVPAYNIPATITLRGPLNSHAFEQSLRELQRRHQVLQTRIVLRDGQLKAVFDSALNIALSWSDVSQLSPATRALLLSKCRNEHVQARFNLECDTLIRVALFSVSSEEHQLSIVLHHIIADGWSIGILTRELLLLYSYYSRGCPPEVPQPAIQYVDYARRQRARMTDSYKERLLEYWSRTLSGMPENVELPVDYPRPLLNDCRGARHCFDLSYDLVPLVDALCKRQSVTRFMVLLLAFKLLLYRYSGQTDIVTGTPVSNRDWADTEDLIGLFVNQMVVRLDLSGNPTCGKLLERLREAVLSAYDHKDMPFEELVSLQRPQRDLGVSSLVQTVFAHWERSWEDFQMDGLMLEFPTIHNGAAKYDLEVQIWDKKQNGMQGYFEYNINLFRQETIERLAGEYIEILTTVVKNPDHPIEQLLYRRVETMTARAGSVASVH
jgi:amino acid adenylation domain-containing protein